MVSLQNSKSKITKFLKHHLPCASVLDELNTTVQSLLQMSVLRLSRYPRKSRGLFAIRHPRSGREGVLRRPSTSGEFFLDLLCILELHFYLSYLVFLVFSHFSWNQNSWKFYSFEVERIGIFNLRPIRKIAGLFVVHVGSVSIFEDCMGRSTRLLGGRVCHRR